MHLQPTTEQGNLSQNLSEILHTFERNSEDRNTIVHTPIHHTVEFGYREHTPRATLQFTHSGKKQHLQKKEVNSKCLSYG